MADLTTKKRHKLPDADFAFPDQRKEPLNNASHARNAMARLNQVEGVSDEERARAKKRIERAERKFGVQAAEDRADDKDDSDDSDDDDKDVREMDGSQDVTLPQHPQTQQRPPARSVEPNGVDGNGDTDDDDYPDTKRGPGGTTKALSGPGKPTGLKDPAAVLGSGDDSDDDDEDDGDGDEEDAGEQVRESIALSMPTGADVPDRIPVRFMSVGHGNAKDSHYYTPEAVSALPAFIRRQPKMFIDHSDPDKVRRVGHRSLRDLAGIAVRETVHYDPMAQACVGEVILHPQFRDWIKTAQLARDDIGLSVDAVGDFIPGTKKCKGWRAFNSVDFVPRGGAGGFTTLPVREADVSIDSLTADEYASYREFDMNALQTMTADDVKAEAPDLYDAIAAQVREAASTGDAGASLSDDAYQALVRENEGLRADNSALAARMDEFEAERNREQTAIFVAATVREAAASLSDAQVAYVTKPFAGATVGEKGTYADTETLAKAVREAAEEFVALIPAAKGATGEITGMGGRSGAGAGAVREAGSGYINPLEMRNAVAAGLALDFGHALEN